MAVEDHFRIEVRNAPDRVVLCLHGELDLASAPLLAQEIESASNEATAAMVVLDLMELRFIDSTGLRIVLTANERAQERGQEFALTRGSEQVQRLLSITGVGEHLRIIASPDELLV
jgi:anti-sigma B factor antagonist